MRFMMMMIPRVYQGKSGKSLGTDFAPGADDVEKMMKYNEELAKAGALIALDGLHPPAGGAQVSFRGGKPTVTDGPFAESKEVLGGYWIIKAKSKEEAVAWAKKVPAADGDIVEVRQVFDMEEFPADVQKAADSKVVQAQLDKK
ncbi:MAG: YciI family protein [Bacteroidota bacterium]